MYARLIRELGVWTRWISKLRSKPIGGECKNEIPAKHSLKRRFAIAGQKANTHPLRKFDHQFHDAIFHNLHWNELRSGVRTLVLSFSEELVPSIELGSRRNFRLLAHIARSQ